jgi:hypothetical protein
MTEPQKRRKRVLRPPMQSGQISIAFESTGLLGLTRAERMKAVIQLSQLLMMAAGVACSATIWMGLRGNQDGDWIARREDSAAVVCRWQELSFRLIVAGRR